MGVFSLAIYLQTINIINKPLIGFTVLVRTKLFCSRDSKLKDVNNIILSCYPLQTHEDKKVKILDTYSYRKVKKSDGFCWYLISLKDQNTFSTSIQVFLCFKLRWCFPSPLPSGYIAVLEKDLCVLKFRKSLFQLPHSILDKVNSFLFSSS